MLANPRLLHQLCSATRAGNTSWPSKLWRNTCYEQRARADTAVPHPLEHRAGAHSSALLSVPQTRALCSAQGFSPAGVVAEGCRRADSCLLKACSFLQEPFLSFCLLATSGVPGRTRASSIVRGLSSPGSPWSWLRLLLLNPEKEMEEPNHNQQPEVAEWCLLSLSFPTSLF